MVSWQTEERLDPSRLLSLALSHPVPSLYLEKLNGHAIFVDDLKKDMSAIGKLNLCLQSEFLGPRISEAGGNGWAVPTTWYISVLLNGLYNCTVP